MQPQGHPWTHGAQCKKTMRQNSRYHWLLLAPTSTGRPEQCFGSIRGWRLWPSGHLLHLQSLQRTSAPTQSHTHEPTTLGPAPGPSSCPLLVGQPVKAQPSDQWDRSLALQKLNNSNRGVRPCFWKFHNQNMIWVNYKLFFSTKACDLASLLIQKWWLSSSYTSREVWDESNSEVFGLKAYLWRSLEM